MKNYEVFNLKEWQFMKFDGRKKIFRGINRSYFEDAKNKSINRLLHKVVTQLDQRCDSFKAVDFCKRLKGTSCEKRIIEGGRNLWFVSPVYGHLDYNKSVFAENTERNRRKAQLINALLSK